MLSSINDTTLPVLREQYRHYALTIRNVCEGTVKARLIYLNRLFDYFGPSRTVNELFAKIDHATLSEFLADYSAR